MSTSSRAFGDSNDNSKIELPVFISPNEISFAPNKRRSSLTVFNPYGNEAQFRLMTTSPERFDVSLIKGSIKPNRRIEITIRLLSHKVDDLPQPTEEQQTIDYFRVSVQVGSLKGNRPIQVKWCLSADSLDTDEAHLHPGGSLDEKTSKPYKVKSLKQTYANPAPSGTASLSSHGQRPFSNHRVPVNRSIRSQVEHLQGGSNVNMVCTLCAIACVITLFLPLAIDSELCKKAKTFPVPLTSQSNGILAQLTSFLSVSYEMKLGCSFALGLFTYRLISTLPD